MLAPRLPTPRLAEMIGAMLPPPVEAALRRTMAAMLRWLPRSIALTWLRGVAAGSGASVRVLVAGGEAAAAYWLERFFAGAPQCEQRRHVPLRRLPAVLDTLRDEVDLTLVHLDLASARCLDRGAYVAVPDWVGMRVPVPRDLAALARGNRNVAEDVRKTRRGGFVAEISHAADDFEFFYAHMYLPHLQARLGAQAHVRSVRRLRRSFMRGGLLWIVRDGVRVAGHLFEADGDTLHSVAVGTAAGDERLLKEGAGAALYVHFVAYAAGQRHGMLDLRGTRASLHDGLLRYKRKWGATLYTRTDVHHACLFHWPRTSRVLTGLLAQHSLIAQRGGALFGVAAAEAPDADVGAADRTRRTLWVPGLRELFLVSESAVVPNAPAMFAHARLPVVGSAAVIAAMDAYLAGSAGAQPRRES